MRRKVLYRVLLMFGVVFVVSAVFSLVQNAGMELSSRELGHCAGDIFRKIFYAVARLTFVLFVFQRLRARNSNLRSRGLSF